MGIQFNSSQYGPPVPVVYGTAKLGGTCIWYGDFKSQAQSQKVGKGGGSTTTGYTYSASFMLGLCEGPIQGIGTVYDGTSTVNLSSVGAVFESGAAGQAAWSHLTGSFAIGYSNTAWLAVANLSLGSSASLPNWNPEVQGLHLFGSSQDANPRDILTDICTDPNHGINFPWLGDLTQYSNYCVASGLLLSPCYDQEQTAQQTLEDLFKYTNSAAWFSEGVLKVQPYGDAQVSGNGVTYTPNLSSLFDLGEADFIVKPGDDPITITRKSPADCLNIVRVEFQDRSNSYHNSVVEASIDHDVVQNGGRSDTTESVDICKSASVARLIAQFLVQQTFYIRNTYEFTLGWRYCMLEPMDIVTLTDVNTGLNLAPVRITEVSEDEDGNLKITAEEFPEGVGHAAIYDTQPNNGSSIDPNSDPGAINPPYLFRMPGFLVGNSSPEIGCAVCGSNELWGGADVYLSYDGSSYSYLGTLAQPARYGALATALPASSGDPDTTSTPQVTLYAPGQLLGGSQNDADNLVTLSMVDKELISYEISNLVASETYQLSYLRRGAYGTADVAHAAGAPFVRLDDAIFRIPVDPSLIGKTVYLKFVSLNVFGRTPRSLAEEAAYTYVVGTNVELPDVPPVPANFATQAIADGVSITWNNANPAAVGCTSIERATASSGPYSVIAQVGPTTTGYTDHFTNGATYWYRARARGPLVSSGWSGYTADINSFGKTVTNGADVTNQQILVGIINPNFQQGIFGWSCANDPSNWYPETGTNGPDGSGTTSYMVHHDSGVTSYLVNAYNAPVVPGQVIKGSCHVRGLGSPTGTAAMRLLWMDSNYNALSSSVSNTFVGNGVSTLSVSAAAPPGAAFCSIGPGVGYAGGALGYYTFSQMAWTYQPSSVDEVPDGGTYIRDIQASTASSGLTVDNATFQTGSGFTVPGWTASSSNTSMYLQSTGTAPAVGGQYLVVQGTVSTANGTASTTRRYAVNPGDALSIGGIVNAISGKSGGIIATVFNASGAAIQFITATTSLGAWTEVQNTATIVAGASYMVLGVYVTGTPAYMLCNYVWAAVNDVRVAGSGARIGDQRNLPAVNFSNYGSGWSGLSCSYTATSTSATVSVSAATLQAGSVAIAYNASSVTITGSAGVTFTYYLYYQDPGHAGGAQTLHVATSTLGTLNNDGNVYVCSVTVTFPTSGSGSGTGGGPCPLRKAWVIKRGKSGKRQYIRAGQVRVGDFLLLCNGTWGEVSYSQAKLTECVRLVSKAGTLGCSTSAPIKTKQGIFPAPECANKDAWVHTDRRHACIDRVLPLGEQWVQHITCQNGFYWTGDSKDCLFAHHNMKPT